MSREIFPDRLHVAPSRRRVRATLLLGSLIIGYVLTGIFLHTGTAAITGKYFDYSVTILMENNDLQSVLAQGSFQSSLASHYTLSTGYSAVSHPSEPNYAALISGQIGPSSRDGICCGQDSHANVVDRLESHGLTWKAFAEGLTDGNCAGAGIDTDHFPFLYFSDIVNNPSRCGNLLGATSGSDTQLISALNAGSGWPNYIWLTPNTRNDAHDTSIAFGDSYLANVVPQILSSTLFTTQKAALFIVYDEGNDVQCSSSGPDCVYASWSGPAAKKGFTSSNSYNHYSYLHTVEDNWGLPTLTSNDSGAQIMSEFFGPSTGLSIAASFTPTSPTVGQSVTFGATISGGTPPYGVGWDFGDGAISIGTSTTHVFSSSGTFNVTAAVTDSAAPSHSASTSVFVTVQPASVPDFQISEAPSTLTIAQRGTGVAEVTLFSIGDFAGVVDLTDVVSPNGLSASLNNTSLNVSGGGSASAELTLVASIATGSFRVTVTGTSGSLTHSASFNVIVVAAGSPGFSLSASPSSVKSARSSSANVTLTVTPLSGFSGNVVLSAQSSPIGPFTSFKPGSVTVSTGHPGSSEMTIIIPTNATGRRYTITVTGAAGPISNSTTVTVRVIKHSSLRVQGSLTTQAGETILFTVAPIGTESGDSVTMSAIGIPLGAAFDSTAGIFRWTPTPSQGGTYTITLVTRHAGSTMVDYEFVDLTVLKQTSQCIVCLLVPQGLTTFWLAVFGVGIGLFAVGALASVRNLQDSPPRTRTSSIPDSRIGCPGY